MIKAKRRLAIGLAIMMVIGMAGLAMAEQAPKPITLKLQGHLIPGDMKRTVGRFVDAVESMSNGQIKIKLFGSDAIVPTKEILNTVGSGALEMALIAEGYWHKLIPVSEVAGLPFAFRNIWEAEYFMYHMGFADMLKKGYAKYNIYHLPYEAYPVGIMSKKPLKTVEDFKGAKIRGYGVMAEWLNQMGASTTYISGGELYTALATGVVEGTHWGDAGPMYIMKFHEVLKNYMMPEPIMGGWNNLLINMDVWKKLTPVQQRIIESAALGNGFWSTTNTRIIAEKSLKKMVADWNVKVNKVPDDQIDKMTDAAKVVWDKVAAKDPTNAEAITKMKGFLKELGYIK